MVCIHFARNLVKMGEIILQIEIESSDKNYLITFLASRNIFDNIQNYNHNLNKI